MKVKVNILMVEDIVDTPITDVGTLYEREVDWPTVPPVGALVLLLGHEEGWSEPVDRVWWDAVSGEVTVEMGRHDDPLNEGLEAALVENGWKRPGSE